MNESRDTGLLCLTIMAQLFDRKANPQQLRHLAGNGTAPFGETDILRSARVLDLKAKAVATTPERILKTPLPAIAEGKDGRFFILARAADDKLLVHSPPPLPEIPKSSRRPISLNCGTAV